MFIPTDIMIVITEFLGYNDIEADCKIISIISEGKSVNKIKKDQSLQENVKKFLKNIKPPPLVKFYIDVDPVNFL